MIPLIAASQAVRHNGRKARVDKTAASTGSKSISHYFKPFSIEKTAEKGDAFGLPFSTDLNEDSLIASETNTPRSSRSVSTPRPRRQCEALEEPALSQRRMQASPARLRPTSSTVLSSTPINPPILHLEQHVMESQDETPRSLTPSQLKPHAPPVTPQQQKQQPRPGKAHAPGKATASKMSAEVQKQILLEKAAKLGIPLVESEQQLTPMTKSKPRAPRTAQRTAPRRRNSLPCVSALQVNQLEQMLASPSVAEATHNDPSMKDVGLHSDQSENRRHQDHPSSTSSKCSEISTATGATVVGSEPMSPAGLLQIKETLRSHAASEELIKGSSLKPLSSNLSTKPSYSKLKSSRFDLQWVLIDGRWMKKA